MTSFIFITGGVVSSLGKGIASASLAALLEARGLDQVELRQGMATDFTGIEPGSFDTVVVNSVVQYFPSIEYLVEVLTGASEAVRAGGQIFLGDLRNLPLLSTLAGTSLSWPTVTGRAPAGVIRVVTSTRLATKTWQEAAT